MSSDGVNVRSGPDASDSQIGRFPPGCLLSFDGYCIGEPEPDFLTHLPDQRWLLVHRRHRWLVSAANVMSFSREEALGRTSTRICSDLTGTVRLGKPKLVVEAQPGGRVILKVPTGNAAMMGYAVVGVGTSSNPARSWKHLTLQENGPAFAVLWDPSSIVSALPNGTGFVDLAASVCLAGEVPQYGAAAYAQWHFVDGKYVGSKDYVPSDEDGDQIARVACLVPG